MKLDKETFIKQHFWFLLGLFVPLVLIALILLWTSTAAAIEAHRKKIEETEKSLKGITASTPKNQKWMAELDEKEKSTEKQKKKIWDKAWLMQDDIMTWPDAPEFDPLRPMAFGEPIPDRICSNFPDYYQDQFPPILDIVQPVNSKGEGVVQVPGTWEQFLKYVQNWPKLPPTSEDLWLAQEDLWMQRELLRIVREANDSVATLRKIDGTPKPDKAKKEIDHQVFVNTEWKLELVLKEKEGEDKPILHYRLINVGKRRQALQVLFLIGYNGGKDQEELFVEGDPLAPEKFTEKELPVKVSGRPDGFERVMQMFDWRTAPVKRINKIVWAQHSAHSNRTYRTALQAGRVSQGKVPAGGQGGAPQAPNTIAPAPGAPPTESKYMGAAGGGSATVTDNGLERERYSDVSDQVRRMPVALVVICDQAHIQDMLGAVANSKLRIQTTQWDWKRYHGDIKPKIDEAGALVDAPRRPVAPSGPRGGSPPTGAPPGSRRPGMGAGPRPFGGAGGGNWRPPAGSGSAAARAAAEEQQWDLVELAVYGVASLYEKPPVENNASGNPPASGQAQANSPPGDAAKK
jgi:hypothetical protein